MGEGGRREAEKNGKLDEGCGTEKGKRRRRGLWNGEGEGADKADDGGSMDSATEQRTAAGRERWKADGS